MRYERQGQLTGCQQLADQLGQVSIVDCRFDLANPLSGHEDYCERHIPGAVFADLNKDLAGPVLAHTGRHPLPEPAKLAAKLGELGIQRSRPVVVYDAGNGAMAARGWWILRWLGHEEVTLLDGGLAQWEQMGLPLQRGEHRPKPSTFDYKVRDEQVVTTQDILAFSSRMDELNLLDARDATRYSGDMEPIDAIAGHVPGSRNVPYTQSLTGAGLWLDDQSLEKLWEQVTGGQPETDLVMMCGSGVTACHLVLSAVQAGCREPRLYVGSWSEWIRDPERPIGLGEGRIRLNRSRD